MKRKTVLFVAVAALVMFAGCATPGQVAERPAAIGDGFIRVEGGTFQMGSPDGGVRFENELPMRSVTVSTFYMDRFPVTQGEWYDLVGYNPSYFQGDRAAGGTSWRNLPVERVNWLEAAQFANAKSARAGLTPAYTIVGTRITWNRQANGYRLPTEAEWEFAARGGNVCRENFTFSGSNTLAEVGWLRETSGGTTHPVGSLAPNALGLYDMTGNVYEWMWDFYGPYPSLTQTNPTGPAEGTTRVRRGGCRNCQEWYVTATFRNGFNPEARTGGIGLRLVRS